MRLTAIDLTPDAHFVVIGGNNGQGKSSIMNSIEWGLTGKPKQATTPRPIRDGEASARVVIDLGAYLVERVWRADDDSRLILRRSDGSIVTSPQAILDALTGEMAFDPLRFATQHPKVQRDTLLPLVQLPFDLDAIDAERKAVYEQRTDVNRQLAAVEARIAGAVIVEIPADASSIADAMEAHRAAALLAQTNQLARAGFHRATVAHEAAQQKLDEAFAAVAVAEQMCVDTGRVLADARQEFDDIGPDPDVEALHTRVSEAEHWAEMRAQQQRALEWETERQALDRESDECTRFITEIDETKQAGLAAAVMPVEGLGFGDDGGITWHGLPFSQASSAEKLRAASAIAMSSDPRIRVMVIHEGSLLDDDSMVMLHDLAVEHDFQVWVERVGDRDASAVIIEDGAIRP